MFYWLWEHFGGAHGHYLPVFNLLRYITFRTGMAVFTAQIVVVIMGEIAEPHWDLPDFKLAGRPRR